MEKLARHIELLLRNNDCVILPGFGGFVAHDVPAYYVSEEGLYYPPSRSISFNASITMNDGLLTQSYMKSYQIDYAHATYMVDMAIEQLTDKLDEDGTATLPRIGTITQDIHQSLVFTPDAAGIASPKHFGLSSFIIKELNHLRQPKEAVKKGETATTQNTRIFELQINKEVLRHVMSTAAVLLLLLMIALPTGIHQPTDIASLHLTEIITNTQVFTPEVASLPVTTETTSESNDTTSTIITTELPTATEAPAPIVETESITPEAEEVVIPTTEASQSTIVAIQPTKVYHIIVASLPSHRGAEETLSQYTRMGYDNVSLVERDDRVRISLAQFTDKDTANEYLKTLRQSVEFQNAWLLAVRN